MQQVVNVAKRIAAETVADIHIVTYAAWLHDAVKPRMGEVQKHGEARGELKEST